MGSIEIEVPNWIKFNPRADRANYSWFRLENDFFSDQRVFMLSGEEQRLYLFILCEASKKNEGKIVLVSQYIAAILRISEKAVLAGLHSLGESGLLSVCEKAGKVPAKRRQDGGTKPASLPATNETYETNETNVTDDTAQSFVRHGAPADFEIEPNIIGWLERGKVKEELVAVWLKLYPDRAWVARELSKAYSYQLAHPKKRYRNIGRFAGAWLDRAWGDREPTEIVHPPPRQRTDAEIEAMFDDLPANPVIPISRVKEC